MTSISLKSLTAAAILVLTAGGAMAQDAVPSDYLAIEWRLVSIDGQPFTAQATIDLSQPGQVSGRGPCNRYSGGYQGTLPDFRPGGIASTRMACDDLASEHDFFVALGAMTRAEVTNPTTLVLSGDKGRYLEFVRPVN